MSNFLKIHFRKMTTGSINGYHHFLKSHFHKMTTVIPRFTRLLWQPRNRVNRNSRYTSHSIDHQYHLPAEDYVGFNALYTIVFRKSFFRAQLKKKCTILTLKRPEHDYDTHLSKFNYIHLTL